MGCCGEREKGPPEKKQRWQFIELNDFKCGSIWTYFAYGWLWFMGFVSVAVYGVDTFTAINLLAFDRWSSQVKPAIDFDISKWIFAGCIFFSWALLAYEFFRAVRVVKRDGVAASYMDPIAASMQSMRSLGWKRFLVYTELTKSKKGVDYVAFFVYFAFQGALRIILAEGPRQFVNGTTLYAVMQAKLIDTPTHNGNSNVQQFFANIGALADENHQQAVIYASMLFTFVIWVFSAVCLLLAGLLYIAFLWHYIPQRDGRLRIYCRRKIDKRLEKIVEERYGVGEQAEAKKREKQERKAELKRQKTGELPVPGIKRAATFQDIVDDQGMKKDGASGLSRQDTKSTVSTLPLYTSRPPTRQDVVGALADRPDMPGRTGTMASTRSKASVDSNAPLLSNAGFTGVDDRSASPAPTYYSRNGSSATLPHRMNTQSTQASQRCFTPLSRMDTQSTQQRSYTPMSATSSRAPPMPVRSNTGSTYDEPRSAVSEISPINLSGRPPMPPPVRQNTAPLMRQDSDVSYFSRPTAPPAPPVERQPTYDSVNASYRGPTPAPSRNLVHGRQPSFPRSTTPAQAYQQPTPPVNSYEMTPHQPTFGAPSQPTQNSMYRPLTPGSHAQASTPVAQGPRRNVTLGGPPADNGGDYFSLPQRSVTSPLDDRIDSHYGSILDDYADVVHTSNEPAMDGRWNPPRASSRAHNPTPHGTGWQGRY